MSGLTDAAALMDSGISFPDVDAAPNDDDGDGLSNEDERVLGTSPFRFDSDDDGLGDSFEVVEPSRPLDSDIDGIIDALENPWVDSDRDGEPDSEDPGDGWQIAWGGFTPAVIRNDGQESALLELLFANDEGVTKVRIALDTVGFGSPDTYDLFVPNEAAPGGLVELFDDGTHGDVEAGDHMYSREGFSTTAPITHRNGVRGITYVNALYVTEGGLEQEYLLWVENEQGAMLTTGAPSLGILDANAETVIRTIDDSTRAAADVVNVVNPELSAIVRLALNPPREISGPDLSNVLLEGLGDVGQLIKDQIDFLYVVEQRPGFGLNAGICRHAANDISGLGVDQIAPLSIAPKLQATVALGFTATMPFIHETAHRWAVFLDDGLGVDGHWGYAGTYGVLGGFNPEYLVDNGDGTYTVDWFELGGTPVGSFSNIELYLMGLIPPAQISAIPVLRDAEPVSSDDVSITVSATLEMIAIEDIVAANGNRVPAVDNSQKDFHGAVAVFSERLLTDTEMAFLNSLAVEFSGEGTYSFYEATGGRATMTTALP
jgi:hypothetical protein